MTEVAQYLPWLNVLILPGVAYVVRLERRILLLEVAIQHALYMRQPPPPPPQIITQN